MKKCAFTDCMLEDGSSMHLKELILRGYSLLPLAHDGILVCKDKKVKGGDEKWN